MTIAIIGAGLMGPAAAYNAVKDQAVERVLFIDRDASVLADGVRRIERALGDEGKDLLAKIEPRTNDVTDHDATVALLAEADVALTALPWSATMPAARAALDAGTPLVDLAIPDDADMEALRREADEKGGFLLLGCGLEPGLTEIDARRLGGKLDTVESIHIMVGGIPGEPTGPLGYKIVFGGDRLPLRNIPALVIENGERVDMPRYSGIETTSFDGVGEVEAWNEGVIAWMLDRDELRGVRHVTQKTIRWPGYAEKARMLNELGLLSTEPLRVGTVDVVPKDLVDTILRPHVTMTENDRDITLYRVEVCGEVDGVRKTYRCEMIDRFDERTGFTSMARTTAITGAVLARMIGDGTIAGSGVRTPDELVSGAAYRRMVEELALEGVVFRESEVG